VLLIQTRLAVAEAGSWGLEEFGNPENGERPQLKASIEQRLAEIENTFYVL
jgi:hypothetical protein